MGGAYFLEDGVEIGNIFRYNLAVFVKTSSTGINEDVTPGLLNNELRNYGCMDQFFLSMFLIKAAFWATNPNNTYEHNTVAGSTHHGWWYRLLDSADGKYENMLCFDTLIGIYLVYKNRSVV